MRMHSSTTTTTTTIHYKSNHKSTFMNYALLLFLPSFAVFLFSFFKHFPHEKLKSNVLFNAQSATTMIATKALKLPATRRRRMPHFKTHTYIYIHPPAHTPHTSLSPVCALMFSQSLSVAVCVSFPGFVAEAFLLLLSSLCSACLHQHFAAIRLPLSLPLSPSSSFTRYCFFVFLFLIFLTHFSLDFVYVFYVHFAWR